MARISSSGTSSPASMNPLACIPSPLSSLTFCRNMSPVEMNGSWKSASRRSAWVPLPAPGGPNRIRLSCGGTGVTVSSQRAAKLLQKSLVVAHHQLRLQLFHGVQRNPDHDQERGAPAEEAGPGLIDEDRG